MIGEESGGHGRLALAACEMDEWFGVGWVGLGVTHQSR